MLLLLVQDHTLSSNVVNDNLIFLFSFPDPQHLFPYPANQKMNQNLELRNREVMVKELVDFESAADDVKKFKTGTNGELEALFRCYHQLVIEMAY